MVKKTTKKNASNMTPEQKIESGFKEIFEREKKKGTFGKSRCKTKVHESCGGAVYGLGLMGALIYYISTAAGFWNGCLGVLKALLWPGFLVFELLRFLGA